MSESKEMLCINVLDLLLRESFCIDEYSLNGPKESAVCLERKNLGWCVYDKEKNSLNDEKDFSNVVEACLEIIERMFLSKSNEIKSKFLDAIIVEKTA